jgi:hypothetical protein
VVSTAAILQKRLMLKAVQEWSGIPNSDDCLENEGSCYTKTAKTLPQAGSVTQPVSAPMSRSRVLSGHAEMLASPM